MQEAADIELLGQYAKEESEEAFAALVNRHVNLVYFAALRKTNNAQAAEEITQAVFIILAKKAHTLRRGTILSGWLYQAARLATSSYLRTELRRARREQEAYVQSLLNETESETWLEIAPLLEDAMGVLRENERNAIVLRFIEGKSFQEVGAAFGASENAAKKRAARALEKLRKYFSKRGLVSTTAVIAGEISANSVQTAPIALAKSVTAAAIGKGTAGSASTLTLIKGVLKIMAWSKAKTAIVAGAFLLLTAGTTTVALKEIEMHRSQEWQKWLDTSVLDLVRRQATIVPALRSRPEDATGWKEYHGMYLGLNQDLKEIVYLAYNDGKAPPIGRDRVIFSVPISAGTYDFISNVPKNQLEALQHEIKKEFGLMGRREWIETNVLFLTVQNPHTTALKRSASANPSISRTNGFISLSNEPISTLPVLLENNLDDAQGKPLGMPVVDRTGFHGCYDLNWDYVHKGVRARFEEAVRDQLGLELVPGKARLQFLVVNKAS